jgi:hypothetical protein
LTNGILSIKTTQPSYATIKVYSYALMERGYFKKGIELKTKTGGELPALLEGGVSKTYVQEGSGFRVKTELWNMRDEIESAEIFVYLDLVNDNNIVGHFYYDLTGFAGQTSIPIDYLIPSVIDQTNGTKPLKVKMRVNGSTGYSEVASAWTNLIQFPFFPGDFSITTFIQNKKVGQSPFGKITIRDSIPETLRGVKLFLYTESGSPDHADYNKTYYIGNDFQCYGFDCSFDFKVTDWVFPTEGNYRLTVSAMLTTQAEDWNDLITSKTINFRTVYREFETARVLEVIERPDHTYRNDEEIAFALQLRSATSTGWENLKNDLKVWLTLWTCDAAAPGGNCFEEDINYAATDFLYSNESGNNYFFWKQIYIDKNGSLLEDTNYYRVMATIESTKGGYAAANEYALLAPKCQSAGYDTNCLFNPLQISWPFNCFFNGMLDVLNQYGFGCTAGNETSNVVTMSENTAEEGRILIDTSHSLATPTQECSFCVEPDENNIYADAFEQTVFCGTWYKFNEAPIDNFTVTFANQYSDLSKTGENAQYLRFSVPFASIAFNDISLLQQSMAKDYGTQADTVGELIGQVLNRYAANAGNFWKGPAGYVLTATNFAGVTPNIGFDCNFDRPIDPTYIDGVLWFAIDRTQVINKQDYLDAYPDLNAVATKDFLEYMNYKGRKYEKKSTKVDVLGRDFIKLLSLNVASPLVIDAPYSDKVIQRENIVTDVNTTVTTYASVPTRLRFDVITDLVHSNETSVIRRFIPYSITAMITKPPSIFSWVTDFLKNPGKWAVTNWFVLFFLAVAVLFSAIVYRKFKGSGGRETTIYTGG